MTAHPTVDTAALIEQFPLIKDLQALEELSWFNPAATATTSTTAMCLSHVLYAVVSTT